jgi:hypothetical protein
MHNSDVYKAVWGSAATSVGSSIKSSIWSSVNSLVRNSARQSLYELREGSIRLLISNFVADSTLDYFIENELR